MKLVAFAGLAGAGKDTCADMLVARGYEKMAFADPLKGVAKALFELDDEQLWGGRKEGLDMRYHKSPRQLLQLLGTDWVRQQIREDFWVARLVRDLDARLAQGKRVVLADVRFQDEVDAVRARGGLVFLVERDTVVKGQEHRSEQPAALRGLSGRVCNDGSLRALELRLEAAILCAR